MIFIIPPRLHIIAFYSLFRADLNLKNRNLFHRKSVRVSPCGVILCVDICPLRMSVASRDLQIIHLLVATLATGSLSRSRLFDSFIAILPNLCELFIHTYYIHIPSVTDCSGKRFTAYLFDNSVLPRQVFCQVSFSFPLT